MKPKNVLILLVLVLGLGTYIYYGIQQPAEKIQEMGDPTKQVFAQSLENTQSLRIQNSAATVVLQKNGIWRLLEPTQDVASQTKVETFLSSLEDLSFEKKIFDSSNFTDVENRLDEFGISESSARVFVGEEEIVFGSENPSKEHLYLYLPKRKELMLADKTLDYLKDSSLSDFRELKILSLGIHDIQEVAFSRKGEEFKFTAQEPEDWKLANQLQAPVDYRSVTAQLAKIPLLRANEFFEAKPQGLKEPAYEVLLGFREGLSDIRTNENDPRPSGMQIQFFKKDNPKDTGVAEYYVWTEKTGYASISQFHFNNFDRDLESYIRKTFDYFSVQGTDTFSFESAETAYRIVKQTEGPDSEGEKSIYHFEGQEAPLRRSRVEQALNHLRNLRAESFNKRVEALPQKFEAKINLNTRDGQFLFLIQNQGDHSRLFFQHDREAIYQYRLTNGAFDASLFDKQRFSEASQGQEGSELKNSDSENAESGVSEKDS